LAGKLVPKRELGNQKKALGVCEEKFLIPLSPSGERAGVRGRTFPVKIPVLLRGV